MTQSTKVWDAPTRLFHWAIVLLIPTSYFTIRYAAGANLALLTTLHELSGYTILTLLIFRLLWGLIGSETSRFRNFIRNPIEAVRHLRHFPRREPDDQIGHNPAGGWMVLVMLITLGVQAVSGLFTFDDVPEGPLSGKIDENTAYFLTAMHHANFNVILALAALHVLAIAAYALVKRHNLLRPMITGNKPLAAMAPRPHIASSALALLLLVFSATLVWLVVARP